MTDQEALKVVEALAGCCDLPRNQVYYVRMIVPANLNATYVRECTVCKSKVHFDAVPK